MTTYHDLVRDNQWWYSGHPLDRQLDGITRITVVVNGRPCSMTHAALGRDGRITRSFRFDRHADRDAWIRLRGQFVNIEVELGAEPVADLAVPPSHSDTSEPEEREPAQFGEVPIALTRHSDCIFGAYLFCDWSASSQPKSGPDSVWFVDGWFDHSGSFCHRKPENPTTRRAAERAIRERLLFHRREGRRTLVGFDFPLGYPSASLTGVVDKPEAAWRDLWRMLERRIRDDNHNATNRFDVACSINKRLEERWYWGTPSEREWLSAKKTCRGEVAEFRLVEEALRKDGRHPFSVWQLLGNGSVGSQSLVGLPVCERLRADQALGLKVWPFETGFAAPERHATFDVLAEVWPGAIDVDASLHTIKDAAQVVSLMRWAANSDLAGTLAEAFCVPSLISPAREIAERVEGWILGYKPASVSSSGGLES